MSQVRVRFAPSPTGYLHIGGARTALYNWILARQMNGKMILRIEDTDTERLKDDSISQILASLRWLGLDWDEGPEKGGDFGPYFQSQRLSLYKKEAQRLVDEGKAYYCFCTKEELELVREEQRKNKLPFRYSGKCRRLTSEKVQKYLNEGRPYVIRLKVPYEGEVVVNDLIRGKVTFQMDQMDDYIIQKSNGMPTYNFACVVDDNAMNITHVLRAEEHLSNTPKQILIYEALGYKLPKFGHMPMILAPDRSKLSKRHGATSVEEFKDQGFMSEAIINYLTLLGWSPGENQEIFSIEDTIAKFSLDKVSKNAAIYDTNKLSWINGQYLTLLDADTITRRAIPYMIESGLISEKDVKDNYEYIKEVVSLVKEKVRLLPEIASASEYFFKEVNEYDPKGVKKRFLKDNVVDVLEEGKKALEQLEEFDIENTEKVYREVIDRLGIKSGDLIHPTRLAISGRTVTPGLFEVMALLGKEVCIRRIDKAIKYIKKQVN